MYVSVLGTGVVGRTLAGRCREVGHEVTIATRDPATTLARNEPGSRGTDSFAQWYADHGGIGLVAFDAVAGDSDLVINATAGTASLEALASVGTSVLEGKVILDVANALDFTGGMPPSLAVVNTDSLGEAIQRAHPDARVVKSLNTMNASVMVEPGLVPGPHDVFVCGDDRSAKRLVVGLLTEFGWPPDSILDLGGIAASRGVEMFLPLWLSVTGALDSATHNVHIQRP